MSVGSDGVILPTPLQKGVKVDQLIVLGAVQPWIHILKHSGMKLGGPLFQSG